MITPFYYEEGSILVRLLIAHCISDFLLQSEKSIRNKEEKLFRSVLLYKHIVVTAVTAWLFLWDVHQWKAIIIIAVTHWMIDAGKLYTNKIIKEHTHPRKDIWLFSIDQLLHVMVIVLVWLNIIHGYERMAIFVKTVLPAYPWLLRLLGYLILVGPVTYTIRFMTKSWSAYLDTKEGLQDAGKWIGMLERTLILTLVYIQQYTAIGFLVAAKSILRLIDKPDAALTHSEVSAKHVFNARKHTEYVLIGTFLSFGFAIIIGLVINWLLQL